MKPVAPLLALLAAAFLLASCAPWSRLGAERIDGPSGVSVQGLEGWMRFKTPGSDLIALTRDGMQIQVVMVELRKHDKAFPGIKKDSTADMLPSEAADLLVADLKSDKLRANMKVLENAPFRVAGKMGFRLRGQYQDERGATFDLVAVGRPGKEGLVVMIYRALSVHYFPRDLNQFDRMVTSLQLSET